MTSRSRWWYGVAAAPVLMAVIWLATFGAKNGLDALFVVSGVGLLLWGVLVPLFSLSLVLDVRALHGRTDWKPSKPVYYGLAAVALLGYVTVLVQFVTLAGAGVYLFQRHTHVGVP